MDHVAYAFLCDRLLLSDNALLGATIFLAEVHRALTQETMGAEDLEELRASITAQSMLLLDNSAGIGTHNQILWMFMDLADSLDVALIKPLINRLNQGRLDYRQVQDMKRRETLATTPASWTFDVEQLMRPFPGMALVEIREEEE